MATMTIIVSNIEKVSPADGSYINAIEIKCDMYERCMEDAMCQICEQLGDKVFLYIAKRIVGE